MEKKNSREEFLNSVRTIIDYWSQVADTKEKAAQGTAFSIMCLLDGVCVDNLDGYRVIDNGTGQDISTAFIDGRELHSDM